MPEDSYVLRCLLNALSVGKFATPVTTTEIVEVLCAAIKCGMKRATDIIHGQVPIACLVDRNDAVDTFKTVFSSCLFDAALVAARDQDFVACRTYGHTLTKEGQQILEHFRAGYADMLMCIIKDIRDLRFPRSCKR